MQQLDQKSFSQMTVFIFNKEGIWGIYKGLTASWLRESVYSTLRLGCYEPIKQLLGATDPKNTPFYLKFVAGGLSGLIGASFSTPADLLKVRMQAWDHRKGHSIFWHAWEIHQNWGYRGFFRGVEATMARAIMLNATFLGTYDHTKHFMINKGIMKEG